MDNEKADYDNTLNSLKEMYGNKVIPIQYPIGSGSHFAAIVDVLKQKCIMESGRYSLRRARHTIGGKRKSRRVVSSIA